MSNICFIDTETTSLRSWWDENVNASARGPLPAAEDPWRSDPQRALRRTGGVR